MRTIHLATGLALVSTLAATMLGCDGYDSGDYFALCSDGKPVRGTAPYEPAHGTVGEEGYPMFFAENRPEHKRWTSSEPPAVLENAGVRQTYRATHERTQLVVCIDQTPGKLTADCKMEDVKLTLHDARYTATLREARTGRVLAKRSFDAPLGKCPRTVMVSFGDATLDQVADPPEAELVGLVAPHLPADVRGKIYLPEKKE